MTDVALQSWVYRRGKKFSFELCCNDNVVHSISVPRNKVAQCLLLVDLLATDDDCILEGSVPVPLAIDEVEAWLTFNTKCTYTDVMMLRALKAADVLVDDATRDSILGKMSDNFVPQCAVKPEHGTYVRPLHPQRLRAFQIAELVPSNIFEAILAAAVPAVDPRELRSIEAVNAVLPPLLHLIMLLPPRCHPTVLHTRLPSIASCGALFVPPLPHCSFLDCSRPEQASFLVQILAAASVFAEGNPQLIWTAGATTDLPNPVLQLGDAAVRLCELTELRDQARKRRAVFQKRLAVNMKIQPEVFRWGPAHEAEHEEALHTADDSERAGAGDVRQPAAPPDAPGDAYQPDVLGVTPCIALPAGRMLTRLVLEVAEHEPPMWCAALKQLRTVRDATFCVKSLCDVPDSFAASLGALTALERVILVAGRGVAINERLVSDLLGAVGGLPRLACMGFESCFWGMSNEKGCSSPTPEALFGLSRLTALTEISWCRNSISAGWSKAMLSCLQVCAGLRKVRISGPLGNDKRDGMAIAWGTLRMAESVYVEALELSFRDAPVTKRFQKAMSESSGVAAARLTSLSFEATHMSADDLTGIVPVLRQMTALQVLNLRTNCLGDEGLKSVAGLLLELPAIVVLDVARNWATVDGVAAVLTAAVQLKEVRGWGLRALGVQIGMATKLCTNINAISQVLKGCGGLQQLSLPQLSLEKGEMEEFFRVLRGLRSLRMLHISDRFQEGGRRSKYFNPADLFSEWKDLQLLVIQDLRPSDQGNPLKLIKQKAPWMRVVMHNPQNCKKCMLLHDQDYRLT